MFVSEKFSQYLADHHFRLWLMPIADAKTGATVRHEALLRANDLNTSIQDFVEKCEAKDEVAMLDQLTLMAALNYLSNNAEALPIAVNMSGATAQSGEGARLLDQVGPRYKKSAMPRLVVEVTETVAMRSAHLLKPLVDTAHRFGSKVVLDDVGDTCCAPLSPNLIYMVDGIKVCAHTLAHADHLSPAFKANLDLVRHRGRSIVVEGIESAAERDLWVRNQGLPTYWQGHAIGRPVPREDIFLVNRRRPPRGAAQSAPAVLGS